MYFCTWRGHYPPPQGRIQGAPAPPPVVEKVRILEGQVRFSKKIDLLHLSTHTQYEKAKIHLNGFKKPHKMLQKQIHKNFSEETFY